MHFKHLWARNVYEPSKDYHLSANITQITEVENGARKPQGNIILSDTFLNDPSSQVPHKNLQWQNLKWPHISLYRHTKYVIIPL